MTNINLTLCWLILAMILRLAVIFEWNSPFLLSSFCSFPAMLWPRQDDVKDDHDNEHDYQEPHNYYQHHPPHVPNPIYRLLEANRIQEEIKQAIDGAIVVQDHTLVEKITISGEVLTGETYLEVASLTVGESLCQVTTRIGDDER